MPKRIQYIDIAKGIGILLVVLAHNDMKAYHPMLYRFIYAFHMPLFFFLSGIFFNPGRPFKEMLKRRFNGLMKPLIFTILLIYGVSVFFGKMSFTTAAGRLLKSLYMTGPYLNWVQLWFLPTLFLLNIYAFFFYRATRPLKDWMRWLLLIITLWIGLLPLPYTRPLDIELFGKSLTLYGAPANLDLVLLAGFFFILARELYRQLPETFFESKITFFGSAAILFGMTFALNLPVVDLAIGYYPAPIPNTILAIAGIIFTISLSRQIEIYSEKLSRFFSYIGSLTLSILVFHAPIQEFTNNKLVPLIGQNDLTVLLAFLAGVALPIFIHEFFIKPNPKVGAWMGVKST